ncbi:MAG: ATPase, partial [Bacteroidota bacterium]
MTFLCICCDFKGKDFLKACKAAGNKVYLLTTKKLESKPWPRESIDNFFFIEEENTPKNYANMVKGLAWLMRSEKIDRVVALDDFDVEKAAFLREEFRIPGMGQTTARLFRDKLAMRTKAQEAGLRIPPFTALFNDAEIHDYTQRVAAPWVVKPRGEASAEGIRKVHSSEQLWQVLNELGEERHNYLLEQFKPGDVYHVDALTLDGEIQFVRSSKYLSTPFEVTQGGGVFRTHTLEYGSKEDKALKAMHANLMKDFGMQF